MSCPSQSSGLRTADAAIVARPSRLHSLQVIADGTNAATVILYDHASAASGTAICKIIVDAGATYEDFTATEGIECQNGIYADVSGTGAEYIVHYSVI